MTTNKYIRTLILLTGLTLTACRQSVSDKSIISDKTIEGEKYAREVLKETLADTNCHNIITSTDTLLKDKAKAVDMAERILFDIFSKEQIIDERPYEVYNVDNYWVMSGTLPSGVEGGVFSIIIDARDCRVLRVTHGK